MSRSMMELLRIAVAQLQANAMAEGFARAHRDEAQAELARRSSEGGDLMVRPASDSPEEVTWKQKVYVDLQGTFALTEDRLARTEKDTLIAKSRLDGICTALCTLLASAHDSNDL